MVDGLPRACAAGRGPRNSAIAVSRGLLQAMPLSELEGVLAHELAHIRHRDVFVQSVAVATAAAIVEASRIGGWFRRWLLFVLGPVASAFVHLLLSPKREFDADRAGCTAARVASPVGGGARPARPGERARPVRGQPRCGAGVHRQSVRAEGPGRSLLHASSRRGARAAACGSSSATHPFWRHRKGPLSRPLRSNSAASYSPGGLPPEYHRRWRA